MKALKTLVIGMGVLIMAGLAVVVVTVVNRASDRRDATSFAPTEIELPWAASVVAMETAGDRLLLRVRLIDGGTRIIVIDLANGREIGAITLTPAS